VSAPALELLHLTKRYPGVVALSDVSFSALPGEIHAICGENGSGKSTLIGIASGVRAADAGEVRIGGQLLRSADPARARRLGLATVYQDDSLIAELSVADNLRLAAQTALAPAARPAFSARFAWARALLDRHELGFSERALVGSLSAADRQLLELVKALLGAPRVLLLDEPTTALGPGDAERLLELVRGAARDGAAVVYVSHRLPEVRALASRITVLRDGQHVGCQPSEGLDEAALVALMVGVPVELAFPPKKPRPGGAPLLIARGLENGSLAGIDLELGAGEIVGVAGAEGNGQRELLRVLAGAEAARGAITLGGEAVALGSPGVMARRGVRLLSGERRRESMFSGLSIRDNLGLSVLERFTRLGLIRRSAEVAACRGIATQLGVVASSLEQEVQTLSGGNQQKVVMGRAFLSDVRVLLVDEPTQGVDAGARLDLYRALRQKAEAGAALLVRSSDASELVGLCDRVIVMSRGRITRELREDLDESRVVGAFLSATAHEREHAEPTPARPLLRVLGSPHLAPVLLALLAVALCALTSLASDRFLSTLNARFLLAALVPAALVALAQLQVLLVGGFDVSVGALMSLSVVLASEWIADSASSPGMLLGALGVLAVGALVGLANAALALGAGIPPMIATIASMSVLSGVALLLRPVPSGLVHPEFVALLGARIGFVPWLLLLALALALAFDLVLSRSVLGLGLRATGFRPEAAARNGVPTTRVRLRGFVLSGLLASLAGLSLAARVSVGNPSVGAEYALGSFAACVLGGASVWGGRGAFLGAFGGALLLTLSANVIPFLEINTSFALIASGALTVLAVLLQASSSLVSRAWAR
jgi:ribose transport system ATP-binding protein